MKLLEQRIIERIDQIIVLGDKIILESKNPGYSTSDYSEWKVGILNLLKKVAGEKSDHYIDFQNEINETGHAKYFVEYGNGVLAALKKDMESGLLGRIEGLLTAEIFTDFLTMAEHLLAQGYKDPAAFLIGATLEEGLRRIAQNNNIKVSDSDDISSLCTKIKDANIFDEIKRKQVMAWKAIRDHADHGKFDQYSKEQVELMLMGARDFLSIFI